MDLRIFSVADVGLGDGRFFGLGLDLAVAGLAFSMAGNVGNGFFGEASLIKCEPSSSSNQWVTAQTVV